MITHNEREIIRQTAGFVATELGEDWKVNTDERYADHMGVYLDGPSQQQLWLGFDWRNPDRIKVRGHYPQPPGTTLPYGTKSHEIGLSRDRGPEAIAKEIRRRLLPGYIESLAGVIEGHTLADENASRRDTVARDFETILGGRYAGTTAADSGAEVSFFDDARGFGRVRLNSDGTKVVEFEIRSLPLDKARRIALIVAEEEPS